MEENINTYVVFGLDGSRLKIYAEDYNVNYDANIVRFIEGDKNIAFFSLRSIAGFCLMENFEKYGLL